MPSIERLERSRPRENASSKAAPEKALLEPLFLHLTRDHTPFLEVELVNPQTNKVEGRGFFNDPDFLLEAVTGFTGRYNFALSPFAYAPEALPGRGSFNQFDRTLTEAHHQESGQAHSLTLFLLFKPDFIKELAQPGAPDFMGRLSAYVDGILERVAIRTYVMDYFQSGVVLRFNPLLYGRRVPLGAAALSQVTCRLLELAERGMFPREHKLFLLGSSLAGKFRDPCPGLPGIFTQSGEPSLVTSRGSLENVTEERLFEDLHAELFGAGGGAPSGTALGGMPGSPFGAAPGAPFPTPGGGPFGANASPFGGTLPQAPPGAPGFRSGGNALGDGFGSDPSRGSGSEIHRGSTSEIHRSSTSEIYSQANIQGLSQTWEADGEGFAAGGFIPGAEARSFPGAGPAAGHPVHPGPAAPSKAAPENPALVAYFNQCAVTKWRWPLYSSAFNQKFRGLACGELAFLQCDAFGAELGFHYLMQGLEPYCREGLGQILLFSKKRNLGDLALSSLARQQKGNPLSPKSGKFPDALELARAHAALFPRPPLLMHSAPQEGLDGLLRYVEHDYLLQQKKSAKDTLMPLAVVVDNLAEFETGGKMDSYKHLAAFKARLHEFNACLLVLSPQEDLRRPDRSYLSLADYHLVLDFQGEAQDGEEEPGLKGEEAWEKSFGLDPAMLQSLSQVGLVKVAIAAHGLHRKVFSAYAFHGPGCLFKEVPVQGGKEAKAGKEAADEP